MLNDGRDCVDVEGVLDPDWEPGAAREAGIDHTVLRYMAYTIVPVLFVVLIVIAIFVILRRWKRSPAYKIFTYQ